MDLEYVYDWTKKYRYLKSLNWNFSLFNFYLKIWHINREFYHENNHDLFDDLFGFDVNQTLDYSLMDSFLTDEATKFYAQMMILNGEK